MKYRYLLLALLCAPLFAQGTAPGTPTSAVYPGGVAPDSSLLVAADHCQTTLTADITSTDTSIPLASISTCVAGQVITSDQEEMLLTTAAVPATVIRHFAGSTAASHSSGAAVHGRISAVYHNQSVAEWIATQTAIAASAYRGTYPGTAIPGASWPNHIATVAELYDISDTSTTLSAPIGTTDLSLPLTSTGYFGANQIALVGTELMLLCGTSTVCTGGRGYDHTTAATHASGDAVKSVYASIMSNRLDDEIIATETDLWGRAGSTTNCPCTAGTGASWPNHIVTPGELGRATAGGVVTAAIHNRRRKEIQALQADLLAHPVPPSPPAPPPPPAGTVDIIAGPYAGCPGSGCAKGNYRSGTDAAVSGSNFTLTATSGSFSGADIGKRGVAVDWYSTNVKGITDNYGSCASWVGWACYAGTSCEFTVATVTNSTSITVTPVQGCGGSGIINSYPGPSPWYWAVYTDDSAALGNALTAAAASSAKVLSVPANAKLGIYTGKNIPAGITIGCLPGGTFHDPHFNTAKTWVLTFGGNNSTVNGCTFNGTQRPNGAWDDPLREYNLMIVDFGHDHNSILNSTFQNVQGTYAAQAQGATNFTFTGNTCRNTEENCLQLNQTGGSPGNVIQNNTCIDSNMHFEDSSGVSGSPNQFNLISNNNISNANGTGYFRSQTIAGLSNTGGAHLDCGTSASGGTPNPSEYVGVTCRDNTITGAHSYFYYSTNRGETVSGNTCSGGCTAVNVP